MEYTIKTLEFAIFPPAERQKEKKVKQQRRVQVIAGAYN